MSLTARNRVDPIDILQQDFEYCSISYYVEGTRNKMGEPTRTLTERSTDVKCSIDQLVGMPTYVVQAGIRKQIRQGLEHQTVFFMIVNTSVTIEPGDVVTDVDGVQYDVLHKVSWGTHVEAFLRKKA